MNKKKLVGQQIKKARQVAGLSQLDLSLELGLSDKAISSYEAGRTTPNLQTVEKLSDILHKPVHYFLNKNSEDFEVSTRIAMVEDKLESLITEIKSIKRLLIKKRTRRTFL